MRCGGVARAEVGGRRCAEGYQKCADAGAWVCRGRCAVIVKFKRGGLMRVGGGSDAAAEARRTRGGYGSGVGRVRICIAIFVEYPNKGYAEYYKPMRLRY